jgi:hypothetical protein
MSTTRTIEIRVPSAETGIVENYVGSSVESAFYTTQSPTSYHAVGSALVNYDCDWVSLGALPIKSGTVRVTLATIFAAARHTGTQSMTGLLCRRRTGR